MTTTELARMHALETQIAATAESQRAHLVAVLERLVAQAQSEGFDAEVNYDTLEDDLFDNMPV